MLRCRLKYLVPDMILGVGSLIAAMVSSYTRYDMYLAILVHAFSVDTLVRNGTSPRTGCCARSRNAVCTHAEVAERCVYCAASSNPSMI